MRSNRTVSAALLTVGLLVSLALTSVHAQEQQQQPKAQSGFGGLQDLLSGLDIGPVMMSFGGASGMVTDFTRTCERQLLQRADVRSELFIDSKQRDQLSDLDQQSKDQLQGKMVETAIQSAVNSPDLAALVEQAKSGKPDPDVLKTTINSMYHTMQNTLQAFQTTLDDKYEVLLRPKQLQRLHELDLQWRGLLALSDKKVADDLKATPEQRTAVAAALKSYQTAQVDALKPVMAHLMEYAQEAAANKTTPQPADAEDMKKTMAAALESDVIKKARASAETKVRVALTASQLEQWKKMTGRKFYFTSLD